MRRTVISGLLLAAAAGLLILLSDPLRIQVEHVAVLGVALGAVLGLVGERAVWERCIAFGIGLVATWLAYGMRAGFLPDASSGRVVAAVGLIALLVLIAWLSAGRLELWPMLIGVAGMAGAYELTYTDAPPRFVQESPVALTAILLTVAVGFAVTTLTATRPEPHQQPGRRRVPARVPDDDDTLETEVPLDEMLRRDEEVRR